MCSVDVVLQPTTTDTIAMNIIKPKKPYKELTLDGKVELIRLAEANPGLSQSAIAERYGIAKSNVCRVLQRRGEYLRAAESARFAGSRKRKLRGANDIETGKQQLTATCNETLRAHMLKSHQISRMFMCRCCNWAFPDKTSLHLHMQGKQDKQLANIGVIGKGHPPVGMIENDGDDDDNADDNEEATPSGGGGGMSTSTDDPHDRHSTATPSDAAASFHSSLLNSAFGHILGGPQLAQQLALSRPPLPPPPTAFGGTLHPLAAAMAVAQSPAQQQQNAQQLFHTLAANNPCLLGLNNAIVSSAPTVATPPTSATSTLKSAALFPQLSQIQRDSADLMFKLRHLFPTAAAAGAPAAWLSTDGGAAAASAAAAAAAAIEMSMAERSVAPLDTIKPPPTTVVDQHRLVNNVACDFSVAESNNNNNSIFNNNNNDDHTTVASNVSIISTTKKSKRSSNMLFSYDSTGSFNGADGHAAFSPTNTNSSASPSNGSSSSSGGAAAKRRHEDEEKQHQAELDAANVDHEIHGQNEFLMQKLLECRERVLLFMRAEQSDAVRAEFCRDLLKITFF